MALAVELCFDDLDAPPERITGVEVPMPYAANLEAASLPQVRATGCCGAAADKELLPLVVACCCWVLRCVRRGRVGRQPPGTAEWVGP